MEVNDGFWQTLQHDLPVARPQLRLRLYRVVAAASVLLTLGVASALFWYFSPKDEIQQAFTRVAALTPSPGNETVPDVTAIAPATVLHPVSAQRIVMSQPSDETMLIDTLKDIEEVSVRISVTIRQRRYGTNEANASGNRRSYAASHRSVAYGDLLTDLEHGEDTDTSAAANRSLEQEDSNPRWAFKTYIGSALPKGDCHMPLVGGVSVERRLSKRLWLETGVQYTRQKCGRVLHTIGIPLKMNLQLAQHKRSTLYASVGGTAEKCVAGAADNSFLAEPVQLSLTAGLGVRYRLNDRFALFAEPSVTHHFDTDSSTKSLRSERPTNFGVLCGLRMTY